MAQDQNGIAVHTLSPVHRRGPAFYASLPGDAATPGGHGIHGVRHRLASILWEHLVTLESPLCKHHHSSNSAAFPLQVVHDPLGKPHLLLGDDQGPAISFSEGGGAVWAALCGDQTDIGMDVAETGEFQGDYPVHRVFHAHELQHALGLVGGDVESAAALLWSIKEAVVKALGCGFHRVDPRDLYVQPSAEEEGQYTFPVGLSAKALERFPMGAGRPIWVRARRQAQMWLSIAFLNGPRRRVDGKKWRNVRADGKVSS